MSSNSEARKAREREEAAVRAHERRREVVQQALEQVYVGAGFAEADCLIDQLADLGASVSVQ